MNVTKNYSKSCTYTITLSKEEAEEIVRNYTPFTLSSTVNTMVKLVREKLGVEVYSLGHNSPKF